MPKKTSLSTLYSGLLRVKIEGLGEKTAFSAGAPLKEYINLARTFITGVLPNRNYDWEIIGFSPEEGVLEVKERSPN